MNKETVKNCINEMINSFTRQDAEKDLQKNIVDRMREEEGIEKAHFKAMARFAYKGNADDAKEELEEIIADLAALGIE